MYDTSGEDDCVFSPDRLWTASRDDRNKLLNLGVASARDALRRSVYLEILIAEGNLYRIDTDLLEEGRALKGKQI